MKTNPDLSFLPLYLVELNKRRAIKSGRGDSRRKSPRIMEIITGAGKFIFSFPGKVIAGIISLADSALWAITGISPWLMIPLLAFLIVFGPALLVEIFHL